VRRRGLPPWAIPVGCVIERRQQFRERYFRVSCSGCGWDFPHAATEFQAVERFKGHACAVAKEAC
jgi:hypothetical protein